MPSATPDGLAADPDPTAASRAWRMAAATFAILALELALIRWTGGQIRLAAYFANLILLATFFGMGLGVGLGTRHPELARFALPALAALAVILATSETTGLMHLRFPDPSIAMWGAEAEQLAPHFMLAAAALVACFWLVAAVFLFAGTTVGALFAQMRPLTAYAADIGGSLAGVVAMALVAWLGAPPPVWFALGVLPLAWLGRGPLAIASGLVVVAAAAWSVHGAVFSPYNRIDLEPLDASVLQFKPAARAEWKLSVNRDFHQLMLDLAPRVDAPDPERDFVRRVYELPFRVESGAARDALIVGAGAGNDAAAALRSGFTSVTSVDIDPRIIALGRELHPEKPYSDPRVAPVVNDARAFFEQNPDQRFAVVCYGLLDSHAMFSAMSSLRLDNYVYTREGLAAGWRHVRDDGVMSVSFSLFGGDWMTRRMYGTLRAATGLEPIFVLHGYNFGGTFLVGRHLSLANVRTLFPDAVAALPPGADVRLPTDDWPFLYLRPGQVPWAYIAVFALIGLTGFGATQAVFRGALGRRRFDPQMFLLGAGFMLLETRMVTQLSLLFGSTWIVNTSVFGGILAMILVANALAQRRRPRAELAYAGLVLALLAIWAAPVGALNALALPMRLALAGLLCSAPIFFAGTIFSGALRERADVPAALGSNLCGAVLGGLLEYLSMLLGMRAIVLLALAIYLGSLLAARRAAAIPAAPIARGGGGS